MLFGGLGMPEPQSALMLRTGGTGLLTFQADAFLPMDTSAEAQRAAIVREVLRRMPMESIPAFVARTYKQQGDVASRDFVSAVRGFVLLHWLVLGGAGALIGAVVGKVGDADPGHVAGLGFVTGVVAGTVVAYGVAIGGRLRPGRKRRAHR